MAYRVWVGSVPIDCDSPEDAIDLAKKAHADGSAVARPTARQSDQAGGEGSRWTEKRAADFLRLIEGKQRKLLDALLEHPDGRTDDQLCQLLGLNDGRQLAGVFTGMWKNAKKVGADPNDLYTKRPATIGGKRVYEYFLSESFRRVAAQTVKT